ncbi:thiolase-like protein [Lipomyces kononenkoae]
MSPKDIVITSALRTPFTKALKGRLARTPPSILLSQVLKATQSSIKPHIENVYVGNSAGLSFADVLEECGFPKATQISTISHAQLSSAIPTTFLAASIRTGTMTCGIVAGVESATKDYRLRKQHSAARKILGVTAEQEKEYTDRSYGAAVKAFEYGLWLDVTVPVARQNGHSKDETEEDWMLTELQDRIQEAQQREVDVDDGYVATPVDGAAAVVFMTREKAAEIGVRPIGRLLDSEVVEDIDDVVDMLRDVGISKDDVDVWEIHESSAREVIDLMHKLHVSPTTVNPNGGALALGDPFGAAGARLLGNVLASLRDIDGKYGVVLIP